MADNCISYGLKLNSAIAAKNGHIIWIGIMAELPKNYENDAEHIYDMQGRCLTPGLIDCHTHIIYSGHRANEFEMRLKGATYEQIAYNGGGIQSTVNATRTASEEALFEQSMRRIKMLMQEGVTAIEIKSGYGLDFESELKILRVAKKLATQVPITITPTCLSAHSIPQEFKHAPDDYIDLVCNQIILTVAKEKLASAVDVFCEHIAFNLAQTERVFQTAQKYGLSIKCHAEQLSNLGASKLAAHYRALSVDHLEYLDEDGVKAIAQSGTVAVLLPGAFYFLRETQKPPIDLLRKHNVPIAIATDCNPGTSPASSLLLMINMACTFFRLTPEEALAGVTKHAAKALDLHKTHGTLEVGKKADIVAWDIEHPCELAYRFGCNPVYKIYSHLLDDLEI